MHKKTCTGNFIGSHGELKVMNVLKDFNLDHSYNSSFNNLKSIKGNKNLRFDFIVYTENQIMLIEFDGAQHFRPVNFGGISQERADANFINQIANDTIKNDYCKDNKFPMLRICFDFKKNISILIRQFILENSLEFKDKMVLTMETLHI